MANQKITALTALTTPATEDLLVIADDPSGTPITKKITLANLLTLFVSDVTVQTLTSSSGTYTPTTGMKKALVIAVGPGGNGTNITGNDEASGGGGGGGTVIKLFSAADVGASKPYAVGASSGNNTTWNTTTLVAGSGANSSTTGDTAILGVSAAGGAGGTATGGDLNIPGERGFRGFIYSINHGSGGMGGSSVFGKGGAQTGPDSAGNNGTAYGGGGSGCHESFDVNRSGGSGAAGVIYVIEFIG
jgi:hypothetical protein